MYIHEIPTDICLYFVPEYCPNCMKDVNYGYKPYPGDCTKYYDVRPDENGGAIQDVKKCPFGTFWDSTYLTCQYTWMVNCVYGKISVILKYLILRSYKSY